MKQLFDETEVRKTLTTLIAAGSVFEIRALTAQLKGEWRKGTVSGFFDSVDSCVSELRKLSNAKGIYFTLNPVNSALLSRCANRLAYAEKNALTGDQHIVRRHWLLLDVDYDRPAGISSTDEEKEKAHRKTIEFFKFLKERGWHLPIVADSGNGYHLLYRTDLPCDDGDLLKNTLAALADRFDGDGAKLDRTVHNPARIVRLYGTLAAKGDDMQERPHRISRILKAPTLQPKIREEKLRALLNELQPERKEPEPQHAVDLKHGVFDVDEFLKRHAIATIERTTEADGGIKWPLEQCPFNPDHKRAEVYQYPNGKFGFHCFHSSCVGKDWHVFREHFEPAATRQKQQRAAKTETEGQGPPWLDPQPLPDDLPAVLPFNSECLPEALRAYAEDISERMQCPLDFPAIALTTIAGALIGRKLAIRPKRQDDWSEIPTFWGGFIARPGLLKTPAMQAALTQYRRLTASAYKRYEEELREWEIDEALRAQSKKINDEEVKKLLKEGKKDEARGKAREYVAEEKERPTCRRYEVNDSTIPKLGEILRENETGVTLVRDELVGLLREYDREDHAGDRARLLEMWDGKGSFTYDRIGRGTVRVRSNTLSILGTMQPDTVVPYVRGAVGGGTENDGLIQRMQLLVWPDVNPDFNNVDRWPNTTAKEAVFELFKYLDELKPEDVDAILIANEIPFLHFTEEAQDAFNAWRINLERRLRKW